MKTLALPIVALVAVAWAAACGMTNVLSGATGEKPPASHPPPHRSVEPRPSVPAESASTVPPPPSNFASSAPPIDGEPPNACEAPDVRRAIAQELFRDEDFLLYICAGEPCTTEEFLAGLTFREVTLRDAPLTLGCIVGPLHEAMQRIYGVFVLNESTPGLALIFMGIDVAVDPAFKRPGFKDLIGEERLDGATWATHRYVWTQRGYGLESTTEDRAVVRP